LRYPHFAAELALYLHFSFRVWNTKARCKFIIFCK